MLIKAGILSLLCAGIVLCAHKDEFVVAKKQKTSGANLKDQCSESLMHAVSLSPKVLKKVAHLQEMSIDMLSDMVDGSFFHQLGKTELHQCACDLNAIVDRQKKIQHLMDEQVNAFTALQKKSGKQLR